MYKFWFNGQGFIIGRAVEKKKLSRWIYDDAVAETIVEFIRRFAPSEIKHFSEICGGEIPYSAMIAATAANSVKEAIADIEEMLFSFNYDTWLGQEYRTCFNAVKAHPHNFCEYKEEVQRLSNSIKKVLENTSVDFKKILEVSEEGYEAYLKWFGQKRHEQRKRLPKLADEVLRLGGDPYLLETSGVLTPREKEYQDWKKRFEEEYGYSSFEPDDDWYATSLYRATKELYPEFLEVEACIHLISDDEIINL